ncbi:hypothetical protein OPT61_g5558 [Boeremia exigua]|uniref:Uncharacterized protein n=1 Tax=Boeremia exigua TaxID=749465 RepID=A0ACC2I9X8_9PLEO|nr:hypothetical protein OPT61_g5558 [Boeremia exigua]
MTTSKLVPAFQDPQPARSLRNIEFALETWSHSGTASRLARHLLAPRIDNKPRIPRKPHVGQVVLLFQDSLRSSASTSAHVRNPTQRATGTLAEAEKPARVWTAAELHG